MSFARHAGASRGMRNAEAVYDPRSVQVKPATMVRSGGWFDHVGMRYRDLKRAIASFRDVVGLG
jgi:hypothetical protein